MNMDFLERLSDIVKHVRRIQEDGTNRADAAEHVVSKLPVRIARGMATAYLLEECQRLDRAAALDVERRAEVEPDLHERPTGPAPRPWRNSRKWTEWIETPEGKEWRAEEMARQAEAERWENEKLGAIFGIVQKYTDEIRMLWTDELLSTSFALPDGTRVTWASATIEHHQARKDMYLQNVHANLEGAARHEHAIRDLTEANAVCLGDLVEDAA